MSKPEISTGLFGKSSPMSKASKNFLAEIIASSDDAIISKDLNGIICSWNDGARDIFGYEAKEIVGQSILRLIPEDLHYEEELILAKIRAGERIKHFETTRVRKSGERFSISVTISPIRNRSGEIIGASKIARDISDRRRIERVAIEAEKIATTGRMAAAIAHEINNPLASVLNLVFLARQECSSRQEVQNYLATAEKELERVSHIARRALGYYRDTGAPVEVDPCELMEEVLSVYQSRLLSHHITVEKEFHVSGKIKTHPGEVIQIFSNLVSNAIDAMAHGGKLSIAICEATGEGQKGIQIVVSDTGHGISPEHIGKVCEPFFTTKGDLGTGIGMWVTRQLVERQKGHISISSNTEPGHSGTTFTIYFAL